MSQTVDRALSLLEHIAEQPQTLGDLAAHIGVHKSTAWRLVNSLERPGFVWRTPDGKYTLGSRVLSIASKALESLDVRDIARPYLTRLNEVSGHTVHLASLIDREVIYLDKRESDSPIRMYSRVGKAASLFASGVGKAIIAYQPEPRLTELIQTIDFQQHTPDTIPSESALRDELARIRERGYAADKGEFEAVIHCLAAPIHAADGSVSSSVSISVPKVLLSFDGLERLLPELFEATHAISARFGWTGHGEPR